jgi:cell division septal protein FtsQ
LARFGLAERREPATPLGASALGRLAWILCIMLLLWAAVGWALDWWS